MTISSESRLHRRVQSGGGFFARQIRPRYVYLAAFLLPMLVMGILWAVNHVTPFGRKMILAHDQWHQYYPFYLDLRTRIKDGSSLLHSWTTGMGTSYLPLYAYYLASPLNLVALLVPDSMVMVWYNAAVLIRIGAAGLFFAFFLRKIFNRSEMTMAVFSTMYALCSFIMGYYWNAIWLDTVALLPLVVVGTVSLLRDGRWSLYTFSLFLSIFCNYYIGLFTCIFVLLLFIGWHLVNWDDLGGFGMRLLKFAFFSLVAVGMTAILTVPTYLGLQSTSNAENKFPEPEAMNIVKTSSVSAAGFAERVNESDKFTDLFDFFDKTVPDYAEGRKANTTWAGFHDVLLSLRLGDFRHSLKSFIFPLRGFKAILSNTGDAITPTSMDGLPNVACGFVTLVLALLYLFCKKIPLKERLFAVMLLFFFGCSFIFRTLDYIWHGFHFPNMLPYRFSFLWSFVVIYMAYRAYSELESYRWWRVALIVLPLTVIVFLVIKHSDSALVRVPTIGAAVVMLLLLLLYSLRVIRKTPLVYVMCLILLAEAVLGAMQGVAVVGTTDSQYYPLKGAAVRPLVEQMNEREADTVDLWRAEVTTKYTLNESTLLGFRGVGVFSSAANSRVSAFLESLGLAASVRSNRYSYQEADPFTNLLLGVKYLIDRNGRHVDKTYLEQVGSQDGVLLLENKAYLPLGFAVSDDALNYVSENGGTPFSRLNKLFTQMTGEEAPLYRILEPTSMEALGTAEIKSRNSSYFSGGGTATDEKNCVEITYRMPYDCYLCFYSKGSNNKDVVFYLNGERQYTFNDKYGCNRVMGSFSAGDEVSLRYQQSSGTSYSATFGAASFDTALFDEALAKLAKHTMITTLVTDTRIEGAVRMEEPGLVYTSIPYDNGWKLKLDGRSTGITTVGDAMIAFHLEPGIHTVELEYEAPGYSLGMQISLICAVVFLFFVFLALIARFRRPPVVKVKFHLEDPDAAPQEPEPPEKIWTEEDLLPQGWTDGPQDADELDQTQLWDPADGTDRTGSFPAFPVSDASEPCPAHDETDDLTSRIDRLLALDKPARTPDADAPDAEPAPAAAPAEDPVPQTTDVGKVAEEISNAVAALTADPAPEPAPQTPEASAFAAQLLAMEAAPAPQPPAQDAAPIVPEPMDYDAPAVPVPETAAQDVYAPEAPASELLTPESSAEDFPPPVPEAHDFISQLLAMEAFSNETPPETPPAQPKTAAPAAEPDPENDAEPAQTQS